MKKYLLMILCILSTPVNAVKADDAGHKSKGFMLNEGLSLSRNEQKMLVAKAVNGDSKAAYKLYMFYDYVSFDRIEAIFWLRTAAGLKHPLAEYNLGMMYLDKNREFYNLENAKRWFKKLKGDMDAEKKLKQIEEMEAGSR